MARRTQHLGQRMIEADNGFGWTRDPDTGKYVTEVFGVTYEMEKRRKNRNDECPDTGWYMYSKGADGGWFGEWCGKTITMAVDEASELIAERDLRGPGYEKEDTTTVEEDIVEERQGPVLRVSNDPVEAINEVALDELNRMHQRVMSLESDRMKLRRQLAETQKSLTALWTAFNGSPSRPPGRTQ